MNDKKPTTDFVANESIQSHIDVLGLMYAQEIRRITESNMEFPTREAAALHDAIALFKRLHLLPRTADGVPVFPGETVYSHANGKVFPIEITKWSGGVNLSACYYYEKTAQEVVGKSK